MADYILEPQRKIPVIAKADLCVVGGSCTGVFAAIRAARLGMRVVLAEKSNMLGGTAVLGLVNIWHSLHDTDGKNQIIAGLTYEVIERLRLKSALIENPENPNIAYNFNPWELTLILDELVRENKIQLMLHTSYSSVIENDNKLSAVIVENVEGRGAIEARFFIDCTGDGRIAKDLEVPSYVCGTIQPPTSCFYLKGDVSGVDIGNLVREHGKEFGLEDDWGWSKNVPGCEGITMRADNHVFDVRCDKVQDLTYAETEGRRKANAFVSMLRKYGKENEIYSFVGMCSHIGVRETVHYETRFKADVKSLLTGKRYDAPVLNGTYRVDIHHSEDMGITFKYLDGRQETFYGKNTRIVIDNWREKENISGEPAKLYQVPFDILVDEKYRNFIAAGRMLNADEGSFGALRVMVNLNQLGEAAGVAAYLCVGGEKNLYDLDGKAVTKALRDGGSAL